MPGDREFLTICSFDGGFFLSAEITAHDLLLEYRRSAVSVFVIRYILLDLILNQHRVRVIKAVSLLST